MYGYAVLAALGVSCFLDGSEGSTGSKGLRYLPSGKDGIICQI